jgi:hypothetical protein
LLTSRSVIVSGASSESVTDDSLTSARSVVADAIVGADVAAPEIVTESVADGTTPCSQFAEFVQSVSNEPTQMNAASSAQPAMSAPPLSEIRPPCAPGVVPESVTTRSPPSSRSVTARYTSPASRLVVSNEMLFSVGVPLLP